MDVEKVVAVYYIYNPYIKSKKKKILDISFLVNTLSLKPGISKYFLKTSKNMKTSFLVT